MKIIEQPAKSFLFRDQLKSANFPLKKTKIEILQVNLGKLCNMVCQHCHVEAGPGKTEENMDDQLAFEIVRLMDHPHIKTLDLTGGAPELNPNFKTLVREAKKRNIHVIDRCNLTILYESEQEDLASFLAENNVEIIASLPCYSKENVDEQRGDGAFSKSIEALKWLNDFSYGREGSGRILNLVYNPVGPHLPPEQKKLEKQYKERLFEDFEIVFNSLYTITNMPITRYKRYLQSKKQYESYVELLVHSFNPQTLEGLMCRNTLSVSWDGKLFDCDFNQMLKMPLRSKDPLTVSNVTIDDLEGHDVLIGNHCFGCTAGAGSSCQGSLG